MVRCMMTVALLASAAHAQSSSVYSQGTSNVQRPVVQSPATRAQAYPSPTSMRTSGTQVAPASHAEPISSVDTDTPLPIRSGSTSQRLTREPSNRNAGKRATTTVLASLSVVLAAFFVLVWLSRKTAPKGLTPLPGEVFESLGRAPLTGRQQMQLIRLGNKLILLSVTSTGAETLTEITDIDEVNRLAGLCQQSRSGSITTTFRQVLSQYAEEPAPVGFVGERSVAQIDMATRESRRGRQRGERRA